MSDKGREGVAEILNNAVHLEDLIAVKILRSHGWIHLDDVVEGKTTQDRCPYLYKGVDNCEKQFSEICKQYTNPSCFNDRPATVRDLIERE